MSFSSWLNGDRFSIPEVMFISQVPHTPFSHANGMSPSLQAALIAPPSFILCDFPFTSNSAIILLLINLTLNRF